MTDATMLAPAGTIREFLTNLGIHDEAAVHSVNIDSVGLITVVLKVRGPDGKFLSGTYVDSPLPVNVTATLRFAEYDDYYEPLADWERELLAAADAENVTVRSAGSVSDGKVRHIIEAFNTQMAWDRLTPIVAKNSQWVIVDETGERGKLRTFTFEELR